MKWITAGWWADDNNNNERKQIALTKDKQSLLQGQYACQRCQIVDKSLFIIKKKRV